MKRILPPTLFLIFIVCMLIFHFTLPIKHINIFPYNLAGIILIILGIILSFAGSNKFKKEDTNIDTFKDPDKLLTDGIFKYSLHPMYLGFAIALLGITIILSSISPFILFISFVLITDQWYIRFEEKRLIKKFGNNYVEYKSIVRRWI